MKLISVYYLGLNDKDEHIQLHETSYYIDKLIKLFKDLNIDNYTYTIVNGVYKGEVETTIKIELIECSLCNKTIQELKKEFNQECIYETIINLASAQLL